MPSLQYAVCVCVWGGMYVLCMVLWLNSFTETGYRKKKIDTGEDRMNRDENEP